MWTALTTREHNAGKVVSYYASLCKNHSNSNTSDQQICSKAAAPASHQPPHQAK